MTGRPLGGHDHPVHSAWNFLALWEKLGLSSISHGFSCSQPVPDKTAQTFIKFTCGYRFFFILIYNENLPRPTGKEKTVAGQVDFVRLLYILWLWRRL